MPALSRHRSARTLTVVTALALAAATGVALAPSAQAYYGSSSTVRDAVLSTAKIASLTGWSSNQLTGDVSQNDTYDWENDVTVAANDDAKAMPVASELIADSTPAARDADFAGTVGDLADGATVVSQSAGSATIEATVAASGSDPATTLNLTVTKGGSDGVAIGVCDALTATTTTTVTDRSACSKAIATAQAAAWAKISPNLVWRSTAAGEARLLNAGQARSAAHTPKGTSTKVTSTKASNVALNGRRVQRTYFTTGAKLASLRIAVPAFTAIVQFGNRTNAGVALTASKAADHKHGPLSGVSSSRYTVLFATTQSGKKTYAASTVVRYADVLVVGSCVGNPVKKPTAATLRSCSSALANAEVSRAASLFSGIS